MIELEVIGLYSNQVRSDRVRNDRVRSYRVRSDRFRNDRRLEMIVNHKFEVKQNYTKLIKF